MKEPTRRPSTISKQVFQIFVKTISDARSPQADPGVFRDQRICLLLLKEGGLRLGELLGMHQEDLDFGKQGVHVWFRADMLVTALQINFTFIQNRTSTNKAVLCPRLLLFCTFFYAQTHLINDI